MTPLDSTLTKATREHTTAPIVPAPPIEELQPAVEQAAEAVVELTRQRQEWDRRPLLRKVYKRLFRRMIAALARDDQGTIGKTIDIGCGGGYFKETCPQVIATDVIETPWTDMVADCQNLPFGDAELRNIVMFDVFHHLPNLPRCFDEFIRVLQPGGRVVMLEPYISPFSGYVYGKFHKEPHEIVCDPFRPFELLSVNPLDGNQGIPKRVFFHPDGRRTLNRNFSELRVVDRQRTCLLIYGLSGGFSGPQPLPAWLGGPLLALDQLLEPLFGKLMAFKTLVVLERR